MDSVNERNSREWKMTEYIEFKLVRKLPKTGVYAVISKSSGKPLGVIRWYVPWRQYVFVPIRVVETVWSSGCLQQLQDFINKLMKERKKK